MKEKRRLDETNNSKEYKKIKALMNMDCPYCPPNKGCNRSSRRRNGNPFKSWKKYRKTQWKEVRND